MDIYELIEHEKLISFHVQTLKLYSALCFQANHKAQHTICRYCDERQLLYAIKSEYMPGQGWSPVFVVMSIVIWSVLCCQN